MSVVVSSIVLFIFQFPATILVLIVLIFSRF
jgi:hypothetical protein